MHLLCSSDSDNKEDGGYVLINDTLNTFYLRLYGIGHMVKDKQIVIEETSATPTWATLFIQQQGIFYMHHPTDRTTHTTYFVTPIVEHWLERKTEKPKIQIFV